MNASGIMLRLKSQWPLKLLLGAGLIVMFAVLYVVPQRFPVFPVRAMTPTWIDRRIPFLPDAVYLYESLYLLIPIAPWLMTARRDLGRYAIGLALMSGVGFCFFLFMPTCSPRPAEVHETNALYSVLVRLDNELNAFPSLHTAYAVFHGACCHAVFREGRGRWLLRGVFWVWALGIIASTLLTKQHVFVDVIAGVVLGMASYVLCFRRNLGIREGARA